MLLNTFWMTDPFKTNRSFGSSPQKMHRILQTASGVFEEFLKPGCEPGSWLISGDPSWTGWLGRRLAWSRGAWEWCGGHGLGVPP